MAQLPASGRPGVLIQPLFKDALEDVRIETWEAGAEIAISAPGGLELLVLEGTARWEAETLTRHSWLRLPKGDSLRCKAGSEGARVWIKAGHLAQPPRLPEQPR